MQITLKQLLAPWISINSEWDRSIHHLCADTRHIEPGDIFIAVKGIEQDGHAFIEMAIQKGAIAILCEKDERFKENTTIKNSDDQMVPLFVIENLNGKIGEIAAKFYQDPSKKMVLIGVTGTNGKTSCTQWIAHALTQLGQPCGLIGTLGYGFPDHLTPMLYTTPPPIELQKILANLYAEKATSIAMEVSSHSLAGYRVAGTHFDIAIFTNLTHDHLDYHGSLENYAHAKKRLFDQSLRYRIFNLDDTYGSTWFSEYAAQKNCYGYSLQPDKHSAIQKEFLVYAKDIFFSEEGMQANVHTPWGSGVLNSVLLGNFNLSNLLAVLTSLCLSEIPLQPALHALSLLKTPPGRMQALGGNGKPTIVIDYAHTPDALIQVLKSLRPHCRGKLWCVFGCGGNRDKTKRPEMGKIAEQYADYVVITSDNPRHENPHAIIEEIATGLSIGSAATIEADRRQAITHAIASAKPVDIVLIAGKGHEPYQQIGDKKLPFSDVVEAQFVLNQS